MNTTTTTLFEMSTLTFVLSCVIISLTVSFNLIEGGRSDESCSKKCDTSQDSRLDAIEKKLNMEQPQPQKPETCMDKIGYSAPCSSDRDCKISNSVCIKGYCRCTPGVMRRWDTQCCVTECNELQTSFGGGDYGVDSVTVGVAPLQPETKLQYGNEHQCSSQCNKLKDCAFYIVFDIFDNKGERMFYNRCAVYGLNALGRVTYTASKAKTYRHRLSYKWCEK